MFLVEAFVVGAVVTLMGIPSSMISTRILPMKNDDYRKIMYLSLFLTGFLTHVVFEVLKINKWYCTNGIACSQR